MQKLAVSAAAVAVCVLPTACDYPLASPPGAPTAPVGGQPGGVATTAPVVVPVGNTTSARSTRDRDRRTRTKTRTSRPTTSVSTAPVTDPATSTETTAPSESATATETTAPSESTIAAPTDTATTVPPSSAPPPPGLEDLLGRTCAEGDNANLEAHTGFQAEGAQCVSTQMGAVAANTELPQLMITKAPAAIKPGDPIFLTVSTRNLVRDRFLGAAAGGYYLEASFLNADGLQRGHFHTACRMVSNSDAPPTEAPAAERSPFFLATQDGGGSSAPDSVTIEVPGDKTQQTGIMQCASWAGDGSHRTPMMSFANQIPAFDSVRINIGGNAPSLPAEPAAGASAEAQADAQQQAEGQQQQAGQAPDQDGGAAQPAPAPAPGSDTAAPATTPAADPTTAAPSSRKSLADRFKELRDRRAAQSGN